MTMSREFCPGPNGELRDYGKHVLSLVQDFSPLHKRPQPAFSTPNFSQTIVRTIK